MPIRLLPYHVFADYEEDDDVVDATGGGSSSSSVATATENSSSQKWEDHMAVTVEGFLEVFEKQVLTFNVMNQQRAAGLNRAEEQLILARALYEDERWQVERLRAALVQHQQREHQREQQEAARARMALAQAQAQAQAAAGAWPAAQPAASWHALAAAAHGEGGSRGQAQAP